MLKKNHYYLIDAEILQKYNFVVKVLGYDNDLISLEHITYPSYNWDHNGLTKCGNYGKCGYCVYLYKTQIKILKELTSEEVMIERL